MSYFINGIVYIIVPDTDITNEMINNVKKDFYTDGTERKTTSGTPKTLFKVRTPISAIFNGYIWYNHKDILIELDKPEWNETL